ncbi:MAG: hypothetical protein QOE51_4793 [Actinoplanes sp.]|nr:hypothetical protein [Actinoplanes sp.]
MPDYPKSIAEVNHVEPAPRRVRATLGGHTVLDTTSAVYVWEWANYPQYYVPAADVDPAALVIADEVEKGRRGAYREVGLRSGGVVKEKAGRLYTDDSLPGLAGLIRFDWAAPDAWFEEDEQIFGHPRNPYARVDAIRSTRRVRVELDGVVLAESGSPVLVFETGLPTRYYLNRTEIDFTSLRPSDTVSQCPYKGTTTGYWTVEVNGVTYPDLAWSYDFPTRQLLPIAGLISFYNEKVDIYLDGRAVERPVTHFS